MRGPGGYRAPSRAADPLPAPGHRSAIGIPSTPGGGKLPPGRGPHLEIPPRSLPGATAHPGFSSDSGELRAEQKQTPAGFRRLFWWRAALAQAGQGSADRAMMSNPPYSWLVVARPPQQIRARDYPAGESGGASLLPTLSGPSPGSAEGQSGRLRWVGRGGRRINP